MAFPLLPEEEEGGGRRREATGTKLAAAVAIVAAPATSVSSEVAHSLVRIIKLDEILERAQVFGPTRRD